MGARAAKTIGAFPAHPKRCHAHSRTCGLITESNSMRFWIDFSYFGGAESLDEGRSARRTTVPSPTAQDDGKKHIGPPQDPSDFLWLMTEEPHRTRRMAIMKAHPEVRAIRFWGCFRCQAMRGSSTTVLLRRVASECVYFPAQSTLSQTSYDPPRARMTSGLDACLSWLQHASVHNS